MVVNKVLYGSILMEGKSLLANGAQVIETSAALGRLPRKVSITCERFTRGGLRLLNNSLIVFVISKSQFQL